MSKKRTETISYRADVRHAAKLQAAGIRFQMSRGNYARELIEKALDDTESKEIIARLTDIERKMLDYYEDCLNLFALVISHLLKLDQEDVKTLMKSTLRR